MAKLGFLGLGIMGYPMAQHLLKAGHEVALWSHTKSKATEVAKEGKGTVCATPREVAEKSDVIFYCVGNTEMVEAITLGKDGLLEGIKPGSVIADCSTVAPEASKKISAAFSAKGASFLDSPVTGSRAGAENATLTFMVGGDQAAFERAKPFMEVMGKRLYYCGQSGNGLYAKLTQNLFLANLMQAFSEGIVLAAKNKIPAELMLDILDNSAAKSAVVSAKAPSILNRDFKANFSTKWMHKDVGLALELGRMHDLPLPVTAVTEQMLRAAIAKGYGDDDFCSTVRVMEEWAGTQVKK